MFYIEALIDKFLSTTLWGDYKDKGYPDEGKIAMAIVRIYAKAIFREEQGFICPFCGKRFISKKGLRVHLAKSFCRIEYKQLVNCIHTAYLIFRYKIMKRFDNGFYLDLPIGKIKFSNKNEIAGWVEKNSDIVIDAINKLLYVC